MKQKHLKTTLEQENERRATFSYWNFAKHPAEAP